MPTRSGKGPWPTDTESAVCDLKGGKSTFEADSEKIPVCSFAFCLPAVCLSVHARDAAARAVRAHHQPAPTRHLVRCGRRPDPVSTARHATITHARMASSQHHQHHEEQQIAALQASIASLQAEIASLMRDSAGSGATTAAHDGTWPTTAPHSGTERDVPTKALVMGASQVELPWSASNTSFVPLSAANCHGVKPCLHTSADERVRAGCLHTVWDGHFGAREATASVTEVALIDGRNVSYQRPLPPRLTQARLDPKTRTSNAYVPFHPSVGDDACDLSSVWSVSRLHPGYVTDATEAHWYQRLRGVRDALWLSLGSSVDHYAMKETCAGFGAARATMQADPSLAYPFPAVLMVDTCRIASLNLTLASISAHGMATEETQRNVSLQPLRFAEIEAQLAKAGWHGGPTFLSFGGMEWDFKTWRCAYPQTAAEWREPLRVLRMQTAAARTAWRASLRGVFVRTMFAPTYGTFGCACCAKEAQFWHYNDLLRGGVRAALHNQMLEVNAVGARSDGDQPGGSGSRSAAAAGTCERIHVLDLQRMMLCNNSVGSCSSRTGWSNDGLHPTRLVLLGYVSLSLQLMADVGSVCPPASLFPPQDPGTAGRA